MHNSLSLKYFRQPPPPATLPPPATTSPSPDLPDHLHHSPPLALFPSPTGCHSSRHPVIIHHHRHFTVAIIIITNTTIQPPTPPPQPPPPKGACGFKPPRQGGKAIVNSPPPTYDQEPTMVDEDDEMSKDNRANQDNTPRINRGTWYDNQRVVNVARARENVAYHKEKILLCKQEEVGFQLNAEQADWRDDTDDEPED
ncbi:hypothetical protein Tco_0653684 [Tanacetum coccineum]|uniref:Uncharacterized protein n=1 Tax=Tanacetum coccineum TaxID=301880 RepID=A0ABQ4X1W3_9ASTR